MLRLTNNLPSKKINWFSVRKTFFCNNPVQQHIKKKSKLGFILKSLGFFTISSSGVVIYAWYDSDFKKKIVDNVPYSDVVLNKIIQTIPPYEDLKKKLPTLPSSPKLPWQKSNVDDDIPQVGLAKVIKPKILENTENISTKLKVEVKPNSNESISKKKLDDSNSHKKPIKDDIALKHKEELELEEAVENEALKSILLSTVNEVKKHVENGIEAQKKAIIATRVHYDLLRQAMDGNESKNIDNKWQEVTEAYKNRLDAVKKSEAILTVAYAGLDRLRSQIIDGKNNKVTKQNTILKELDSKINKFDSELNSVKFEYDKLARDAKVLYDYHDLVKNSKRTFRDEIEAVFPDIKIGRRFGEKMTTEELNLLIAHAHRKIEQFQEQLAHQRATEVIRVQASIEGQKKLDEEITKEAIENERNILRGQLETIKNKWDLESKIKFEEELRQQLMRQAAAHSDHLTDVLKLQEEELKLQHELSVRERILDERDQFDVLVASSIARLRGIEKAVENRANIEEKARQAQKLWIACQSLLSDVSQIDSRNKPLTTEIESISFASDNHPFVNRILNSIDENIRKDGVRNEEEIKQRFNKVRRLCKRVAMIDENGGSLWQYFVSYIQSLFVISASKPFALEEKINMDEISTFVLLDNAKYYLEKNDLLMALKFMNQLRGEARFIAKDWINDTRHLLEARQAANILMAYASAASISSKI